MNEIWHILINHAIIIIDRNGGRGAKTHEKLVPENITMDFDIIIMLRGREELTNSLQYGFYIQRHSIIC
jgi:hypothetical protein